MVLLLLQLIFTNSLWVWWLSSGWRRKVPRFFLSHYFNWLYTTKRKITKLVPFFSIIILKGQIAEEAPGFSKNYRLRKFALSKRSAIILESRLKVWWLKREENGSETEWDISGQWRTHVGFVASEFDGLHLRFITMLTVPSVPPWHTWFAVWRRPGPCRRSDLWLNVWHKQTPVNLWCSSDEGNRTERLRLQPRWRWVSATLRPFFHLRLQIWDYQAYDPPPLSFVIYFFPSGKCEILHNSFSYFGLSFWAKVPGCGLFNNSPLRFVNNQWKNEGQFSLKDSF